LGLAAAAVVAAGVAFAVIAAMRGPHFVHRVTVVNPTAYDLDVDATGAGRHGWVGVGTVRHGGSEAFQDVIDQGATWILRFSYGGQLAGELRFNRQELVRAGWRVTVPASFADPLVAAHISPPPR
jgi:hypothetical protein